MIQKEIETIQSYCQHITRTTNVTVQFHRFPCHHQSNLGVHLTVKKNRSLFGNHLKEIFESKIQLFVVIFPLDIRMFFYSGENEVRDGHISSQILFHYSKQIAWFLVDLSFFIVVGIESLHFLSSIQ